MSHWYLFLHPILMLLLKFSKSSLSHLHDPKAGVAAMWFADSRFVSRTAWCNFSWEQAPSSIIWTCTLCKRHMMHLNHDSPCVFFASTYSKCTFQAFPEFWETENSSPEIPHLKIEKSKDRPTPCWEERIFLSFSVGKKIMNSFPQRRGNPLKPVSLQQWGHLWIADLNNLFDSAEDSKRVPSSPYCWLISSVSFAWLCEYQVAKSVWSL